MMEGSTKQLADQLMRTLTDLGNAQVEIAEVLGQIYASMSPDVEPPDWYWELESLTGRISGVMLSVEKAAEGMVGGWQ